MLDKKLVQSTTFEVTRALTLKHTTELKGLTKAHQADLAEAREESQAMQAGMKTQIAALEEANLQLKCELAKLKCELTQTSSVRTDLAGFKSANIKLREKVQDAKEETRRLHSELKAAQGNVKLLQRTAKVVQTTRLLNEDILFMHFNMHVSN